MKFLNEYHKESSLRKMKKVAEMHKRPVDFEKEKKRIEEMHARIARMYPDTM